MVVLWVYWPATGHDFISLDDPEYVTQNVHVQGGLTWEDLKWAFTNPVAGNWHPITMLSHMLDCQLFGLKPWGPHLVSVLLHTANTVLLFLFLRGVTGAVWRSLMVAALFGLHPLHVESVAWVAERKDVLSTFFGLLTLMAYARYVQSLKSPVGSLPRQCASTAGRQSPMYLLALLFFALGLMSKPMLVTLPFLLLLLDYWPLKRISEFPPSAVLSTLRNIAMEDGLRRTGRFPISNLKSLLAEKIPFFVLAAVMCVVTYFVQHARAVDTLVTIAPGDKMGNVLVSYAAYMGKLLWPTKLAVFYPFRHDWPLAQVLGAGVLILAVSILCVMERIRRPYLLVGWLWFLGTLVPVIGLVQVGAQAMADRYMYIPSVGLLICIVWGASDVARRWPYHRIILGAAGCAAVILCAGATRQQLGYWRNDETLYRHAIEVTHNNYLMHYFLGVALANDGKLNDAIGEYQEAIRIKPDYAAEHYDLGNALARDGQINEAILQLREAIRLKPDYDKAFSSLGTVLGKAGQTEEAIVAYRKAISLKPDNAQYHFNFGLVLLIDNQVDGGITQFQEAIRLKPDFTEARHYLGIALQIKNAPGKTLP